MITIAKMIREDKNVSKDDLFVQEEMTKVMELETEIANVSTEIKKFSGVWVGVRQKCLTVFCSSLTQHKTHGQEEKEGGKRLCAVISPETRASACIINPL